MTPVLLDITRTVARARLPAPTGIDRVERAYIDWALGRDARYVARIGRRLYLPDRAGVAALVAWLDGGAPAPALDLTALLRPARDRRLARARAAVRRAAEGGLSEANLALTLRRLMPAGGVYLNVGHDNLSVPLMAALARARLGRLVMVHDTIPLDHPHLTRTGTPARFRDRLRAAEAADGVLCNSAATGAALCRHMAPARLWVAPLGAAVPAAAGPPEPGPAYFLCLGTIEPRKNHALLLDVWERLGDGAEVPHLCIAGRRGWADRALLRRLDRDPLVGRTVHELGTPDDATLARLIAGARALLFPSRAEGYGLPLVEALAAGVPVIASDLPALREVGGAVPDWLSPDDTQGWLAAVRAYAANLSPVRDRQLARMAEWQAPGWATHFRIVENAITTVSPGRGAGRRGRDGQAGAAPATMPCPSPHPCA